MANKNNKTAKDLAFDRERAKYGRQIRDLEDKLREKDKDMLELREQLRQAESKCESLQEWIDRLLDYTNMSEEDMKTIVQKDRDAAEAMSMMKGLFGIVSSFGRYPY